MDILFLRKPAFSHSTILGFERCFLHLRNDEEAQWVWQKKFLGVISDGFVLPLIMTKQNITAPGKHVLSLDEGMLFFFFFLICLVCYFWFSASARVFLLFTASVKSQKTAILEDTDASHLYRLLASRRVPP